MGTPNNILQCLTDKIIKILWIHNIMTVFKPQITINLLIRNLKDKILLEDQGVYEIICGD